MRIADLSPILLTRMEVLDPNNDPTGVFFTGHTPISPEWEEAHRRHFPPTKSTTLIIGKGGENRMEIPNDPKATDKRRRLLAAITTNVEGLDDFDPEKDDTLELFRHPAMRKAVAQWWEHLDDEGKHSPPSETSAKRTSKSSAG